MFLFFCEPTLDELRTWTQVHLGNDRRILWHRDWSPGSDLYVEFVNESHMVILNVDNLNSSSVILKEMITCRKLLERNFRSILTIGQVQWTICMFFSVSFLKLLVTLTFEIYDGSSLPKKLTNVCFFLVKFQCIKNTWWHGFNLIIWKIFCCCRHFSFTVE